MCSSFFIKLEIFSRNLKYRVFCFKKISRLCACALTGHFGGQPTVASCLFFFQTDGRCTWTMDLATTGQPTFQASTEWSWSRAEPQGGGVRPDKRTKREVAGSGCHILSLKKQPLRKFVWSRTADPELKTTESDSGHFNFWLKLRLRILQVFGSRMTRFFENHCVICTTRLSQQTMSVERELKFQAPAPPSESFWLPGLKRCQFAYCHQRAVAHCHQLAVAHCHQLAVIHCHQLAVTNCHQLAVTHCHQIAMTHCHQLAVTHCHQLTVTHCHPTPPRRKCSWEATLLPLPLNCKNALHQTSPTKEARRVHQLTCAQSYEELGGFFGYLVYQHFAVLLHRLLRLRAYDAMRDVIDGFEKNREKGGHRSYPATSVRKVGEIRRGRERPTKTAAKNFREFFKWTDDQKRSSKAFVNCTDAKKSIFLKDQLQPFQIDGWSKSGVGYRLTGVTDSFQSFNLSQYSRQYGVAFPPVTTTPFRAFTMAARYSALVPPGKGVAVYKSVLSRSCGCLQEGSLNTCGKKAGGSAKVKKNKKQAHNKLFSLAK